MKDNGKLTKSDKLLLKNMMAEIKACGVLQLFYMPWANAVAAVFHDPGNDHGCMAVAYCHPGEEFRRKTGRFWAVSRIYKSEVMILRNVRGDTNLLERIETIVENAC